MDAILAAVRLEQVSLDKILAVRLADDDSLIVVVDNGSGCPKHIYMAKSEGDKWL